MANPEHLKVLRQGIVAWNQWRLINPNIVPNFSGADLGYADLMSASFKPIVDKLIADKHLQADRIKADFSGYDLGGADLSGANLHRAYLVRTDFSGANLNGANLVATILVAANLSGARLSLANLSQAHFSWTVLTNTDLSEVKGLESVIHHGPSSIGIDTFFLSKGRIPEVFLRGAGVPDAFIKNTASLAGVPEDFYSCFISYSSKDKALAERLHADLQGKGVRCWFAPEDIKTGDKFRVKIDEAVRFFDKLLLLLSKHSVNSDWVEKEVETAFEKERRSKHTVLFPVRLDEAVMKIESGWPADIRRSRHIGDFMRWKDHNAYQKAFDRLLRDLKSDKAPPSIPAKTA